MMQIISPNIKLKNSIDRNDYEEIKNLQKLCLEQDHTALKLELDYKLNRADAKNDKRNDINEFMYYETNKLVGYIGICCFGGEEIEINGMVHPDFRRRGIFTTLFSYVKEEWIKRECPKALLLCDHNSISGQKFIKRIGTVYDHSEYEMYLRGCPKSDNLMNQMILRKAMNKDAKEIARQNAIYFGEDISEEAILMPEEEEKSGYFIFLAEAEDNIIGKVHLDINDSVGGIFGLGVIPEYRKKGYGREILIQSIRKLIENGSQNIMLQVATKNKSALKIYQSCGFEETSTMEYFEIT